VQLVGGLIIKDIYDAVKRIALLVAAGGFVDGVKHILCEVFLISLRY